MKLALLLLSLPLFVLSAPGCRDETAAIGTWGLKRISQEQKVDLCEGDRKLAIFENYVFDGPAADLGKGVDIYILDGGVNVDHKEFGGRAIFGFSVDGKKTDDDGHGTHTAGTAGSETYGVAKGANIISVRLGGSQLRASGVVEGIKWMLDRHESRKGSPDFRGSVASMSVGLASAARADDLDDAVKQASAAGIHFAVTAGNQGLDACAFTPGRLSECLDVITVGAIDVNDHLLGTIGKGTNFGKCVSVYAPGQDILSTWHTSPGTSVQSGTSMACPHVSGLMAVLLAQDESLKFATANLKRKIIEMAIDVGKDPAKKHVTVLIANNGKKQNA